MPPKKIREQRKVILALVVHEGCAEKSTDARQAHNTTILGLAPEVIAKRTKRHLDELEVGNFHI
jgi:hypothetical protein